MNEKTLLMGEPMGLFIAQEEGELEDVSGYSLALAGAEFNVAVGMRRLGHPVGYFTKLGVDPFGKRVLNMMRANQISTDLILTTSQRNTGFMLKSMVRAGDPKIYYYRKDSAASTLCAADVEALDLGEYSAVHLTGITPAISDTARAAVLALGRKARDLGMRFSFDPNLRPQLWPDRGEMISFMNHMAANCDLFLPGINEAKILLGEEDPEIIAQTYLDMGAGAVAIKLGARGAYYANARSRGYAPGFPVARVVDTVGAGDGFAAGVLSGLGDGRALGDAVLIGNAVGAIQVMSRGDNDGLPTREELEKFMAGRADWRMQDV